MKLIIQIPCYNEADTFVIGMLADVISANRKILEDVQYHLKKQEK